MESMFCYQCEQTTEETGCTVSSVCGKKPDTAQKQDVLTCEIIGLAGRVALAHRCSGDVLTCEMVASVKSNKDENLTRLIDLILDGLLATLTNVNFDTTKVTALIDEVRVEREALGGEAMGPDGLFNGDENIVSLRSTLLLGLRGMAAYAHHARVLGRRNPLVDAWFIKGMAALENEHTVDEWLDLLMEFGGVNLQCMAMLDEANTESFGNPIPAQVSLKIEKGPFIVVTGHDLRDLQMLLEQTDGKGINIYTHSEMLPAHGYPSLKKYPHLKGNFGTAWQNQQKEFNRLPAPLLFTTNCLMPPRLNYADRAYTTSLVAFPEMKHIEVDSSGHKDFTPLINHAIELGGFAEDQQFTGINGGSSVTTGFGRQTILDNAPAIIDAVKAGAIKHFFLVGGCDGNRPERAYYTDFVKLTPKDTVVLTLGCGKFRFNDIDAGAIGPFPRILDMGQCNDAYGAIQVAVALARAFDCNVNDLPLTLVLSWYEQKAVCILLTLFSLGIRNIYIGPTIPAFFSDAVVSVLIEKFNLHPIGTPEGDLAQILKT